jgi:predicted glycogen debranching enzyme
MKKEIEWLETDGLGGFAMGTSSLIPRRRYHSMLTSALTPPTNRMCLLNTVQIHAIFEGKKLLLSDFQFGEAENHPAKASLISSFECQNWPKWTYAIPDLGLELKLELFMPRGTSATFLCWKQTKGRSSAALEIRPLISVRDHHSLHFANETFNFEPKVLAQQVVWAPYQGCPNLRLFHNGTYTHEPLWFYNFFYSEERARGFDFNEDLASPGTFRWELGRGTAYLVASSQELDTLAGASLVEFDKEIEQIYSAESQRRATFPSPLHKAADAYLVQRNNGKTIIAGYPWFTDWGRDTFIAFRGICLSSKRLEEGAQLLSTWRETLSEGMVPNRFPDTGGDAEYNSVDASLWFIIAAYSFMKATPRKFKELHAQLKETICEIVAAYIQGTRFNISADPEDSLLRCGLPGTQLTWMDAKIDQTVFTPRAGKPVEIQALWINALSIASRYKRGWSKEYHQALTSFREKFWYEQGGYLFDVIDVDHQKGRNDCSLRPNQLLAIGGLPLQLIEAEQAISVVKVCEGKLFTPYGMRTLSPDDERFRPRYEGNGYQRDSAYHQGTAWPWLLGPFVEAWIRVQKDPEKAKEQAKKKFLGELLSSLFETGGAGHINEIHDATAPFQGRGCPFQAWSVAEVLRLFYEVLHTTPKRSSAKSS